MKKFDKKEIFERAVKTFFEGFLGSIATNFALIGSFADGTDNFRAAMVSLLVGGVSAGISLAWNMVFGPLFTLDREETGDV